ncbi:MAG: hypothetical protein S4CHLAM37_15450 [Chlamydiia bacterium]|nr:hypothetical protein [Chlamydiia bacterium]
MKYYALCAILAAAPVSNNLLTSETNAPTYFNTEEGQDLLLSSNHRCDFWQLIQYYDTQKTYAHCSVASSVMVLNALGVEKPKESKYRCYPLFTQDNFFTERVKAIVDPDDVARRGMSVDEITQSLNSFNGVDAQPFITSEISLDEFRSHLQKTLRDKSSFIIVNYLRTAIEQTGGGHFSPVGAYNEKEDKVLVLDVSRYRYAPVWVKTETLYKAMGTVEGDKNSPRGFVTVSKS